jgi:hypothetical protein
MAKVIEDGQTTSIAATTAINGKTDLSQSKSNGSTRTWRESTHQRPKRDNSERKKTEFHTGDIEPPTTTSKSRAKRPRGVAFEDGGGGGSAASFSAAAVEGFTSTTTTTTTTMGTTQDGGGEGRKRKLAAQGHKPALAYVDVLRKWFTAQASGTKATGDERGGAGDGAAPPPPIIVIVIENIDAMDPAVLTAFLWSLSLHRHLLPCVVVGGSPMCTSLTLQGRGGIRFFSS